tara:strand:+ start:36675 stop:37079 length:405 start_codon:yes stop_codon:yes gene_type:complete
MSEYQTTQYKGLKLLDDTLKKLRNDIYRIIELPNGYYFCGYVEFSSLSSDILNVEIALLDMNFSKVESVDLVSFNRVVAESFLRIRADYQAWIQTYLSGGESSFRRDEEAEKLFSDFINKSDTELDLDIREFSL